MTRNDRRKPNMDREPPRYPRRSPALDGIERKDRGIGGGVANRGQAPRRSPVRSARYAADESVSGMDFNSVGVRKLPPLRPISKSPAVQVEQERMHSGVTAGWRKRASAKLEQPIAAPVVQGLSEEETKKLSELEMRLPRI